MEITLTYHSSRAEVMRLYCRLWKVGLWKIHLVIFLFGGLCMGAFLNGWVGPKERLLFSMLGGAFLLASFVAFPLIAFKSQRRVIVVSEAGLTTTIGEKSGAMRWDEVKSIERAGPCTYILRKNLNAFIIPDRAFNSIDNAKEFFQTISEWQKSSGCLRAVHSDGQ